VLLYGPPGCGKTFIARRLAKELNYNFTEVSPAAVASPYIHDTVLKISNMFQDAARNAPALIFVDEFEGLVPARSDLGVGEQYKAEEVNEWLVQLSSCAERRILFVAATNEPWKIDQAVQRTGRLDKKIYVGPPDREAIIEILNHHLAVRGESLDS
jgi:transitional endoplasmic reticulum ATPase